MTGPGLTFIEGGSFTQGRIEQDVMYDWNNVPKRITRMFFIIAITIPFDIRDVEYDKKKTYTIPMLVGDKMAKKIAVFFLLLFLIIDSYLYLNNLNFGFFISTILLYRRCLSPPDIEGNMGDNHRNPDQRVFYTVRRVISPWPGPAWPEVWLQARAAARW